MILMDFTQYTNIYIYYDVIALRLKSGCSRLLAGDREN